MTSLGMDHHGKVHNGIDEADNNAGDWLTVDCTHQVQTELLYLNLNNKDECL